MNIGLGTGTFTGQKYILYKMNIGLGYTGTFTSQKYIFKKKIVFKKYPKSFVFQFSWIFHL
jgi:hypothetical protein